MNLFLCLATILCMSSHTSTAFTPSRPPSPRIFLITGATDGIGRHTAKKLASDGHGLIVHGRQKKAGEALKSELRGCGAAFVHYLNYDLSDLSEVELLADAVCNIGGDVDRIDVLVNNAGVFDPEPRYSKQGYDMTWAVNVMAPFVLTRRLLPLIAKGRGPRIITTSSMSQSSTLPDLSNLFARKEEQVGGSYSAHRAYSDSKLGDLMFTAKLAQVLSSSKQLNNDDSDSRLSEIKCLTMDPGTVNTKMLIAGWGACGITVSKADNTYKLAATDYGAQQPTGSYHFGFSQAADSRNDAKLQALWDALEEHTGCTYSDIAAESMQ